MRGSKSPERYTLPDMVRKDIDDGNMFHLFRDKKLQGYGRPVDFYDCAQQAPDHRAPRYSVMLSGGFPEKKRRHDLFFVFPNHPNVKKQVMNTHQYWKTSSMNAELNARIQTSADASINAEDFRLAVAFGENVYWCKHIQGNVYVFYARFINRINEGNVANTIYTNVPVLLVTNGRRRPIGWYIFRPEPITSRLDCVPLTLTHGNPIMLYPKGPLFVCDGAPEQYIPRRIRSVSEDDAMAMMLRPTNDDELNWVSYEVNPFKAPKEPITVADDGDVDCVLSPRLGFVPEDAVEVMMMPLSGDEPDPFAPNSNGK